MAIVNAPIDGSVQQTNCFASQLGKIIVPSSFSVWPHEALNKIVSPTGITLPVLDSHFLFDVALFPEHSIHTLYMNTVL